MVETDRIDTIFDLEQPAFLIIIPTKPAFLALNLPWLLDSLEYRMAMIRFDRKKVDPHPTVSSFSIRQAGHALSHSPATGA